MITLINHIDSCLGDCLPGKYFGLCKLVNDDKGEHYPRTVGKEAIKVTPNDNYKALVYHRLLDGSFEDSEDMSFGRSVSRINSQRIRMVVALDIKIDLDESTINKVIEGLPERISNSAYKFSGVNNSVSLVRDSESVWETEWGKAYKDKYQMRYNLYAVEYAIDYIKCEECVS